MIELFILNLHSLFSYEMRYVNRSLVTKNLNIYKPIFKQTELGNALQKEKMGYEFLILIHR